MAGALARFVGGPWGGELRQLEDQPRRLQVALMSSSMLPVCRTVESVDDIPLPLRGDYYRTGLVMEALGGDIHRGRAVLIYEWQSHPARQIPERN